MSVYVITTNNIYVILQVYDEKCDMYKTNVYITNNNICLYIWYYTCDKQWGTNDGYAMSDCDIQNE